MPKAPEEETEQGKKGKPPRPQPKASLVGPALRAVKEHFAKFQFQNVSNKSVTLPCIAICTSSITLQVQVEEVPLQCLACGA